MRTTDEPSLDSLDDHALLRLASSHESSSSRARFAQAAFYQRHIKYLYGVLKRREAMLARVAGLSIEDLAQETFQRAFQYGSSYRGGTDGNAERERIRVRAWLGRIAQNLVLDAIAKTPERSDSPLLERITCDELDEESPPSSPELRAIREGLAQLTEREQDVLRVTALYQRAGEDYSRLPNDVSSELAARWSTTNQNIRAIRSRAMKRLSSLVHSLRGSNPPSKEKGR